MARQFTLTDSETVTSKCSSCFGWKSPAVTGPLFMLLAGWARLRGYDCAAA